MINEEYKRRLTGKVANAIVTRLQDVSDEKLVDSDINRLFRLHTDGQIPINTLAKALEAVKENHGLPQQVRDGANERLDQLSKKFHVDISKLATDTPKEEVPQSASSDHSEYRSTNVICPASTDVKSLPQSGWTQVTGDTLANFLGQIGPVDGVIRTVPETTSCYWHALPWYENVVLVRLTDSTWKNTNLAIYYLSFNDSLYRLNGTSPPIHEVNANAPIKLSSDNVADYLRFFCFFVRGEEGPFYIAEDINDPFIPSFEDSPAAQAVFSEALTPVSYEGQNEQGYFLLQATVFYSNTLFTSNFAIRPTGLVEMLEDILLAGDIPGKVNAPLQLDDIAN